MLRFRVEVVRTRTDRVWVVVEAPNAELARQQLEHQSTEQLEAALVNCTASVQVVEVGIVIPAVER